MGFRVCFEEKRDEKFWLAAGTMKGLQQPQHNNSDNDTGTENK